MSTTPQRSAAWNSFRATPLGELLTGSAHEAHPTDLTAPLGVRFAGKTLLALHIALEKAATVRVSFDPSGKPRLSGIRHIKQRNSSELLDVLRSEAAATGAKWVAIVAATGWHAMIGQRAARPDPADHSASFARHRLMFETPEVVVPRAQLDRVYTAVDHPVLDKSVVFSMKRRELEDLFADIRKCGLGIASVRIAVAAQLELWLASHSEAGTTGDVLLTDGLSALLLNIEQGDFIAPRGAVEQEQPRQAVQRPSTIDDDIARFIHANAGRSITFVGPEDLCASVKRHSPEAEIVRPPDLEAHDSQLAALSPAIRHDLNFEAHEMRPSLPASYRRLVLGYMAAALLLAGIAVVNSVYAARVGYRSFRLERDAAQRAREQQERAEGIRRFETELAEASLLRSWVSGNYHAQRLCHALLRDIPQTAGLDSLQVEMRDGQIALSFVVLGDKETQLSAHRAIERAIKGLKHKIGGEEMPVGVAGGARAVQYRMHLIASDPGEVSAP